MNKELKRLMNALVSIFLLFIFSTQYFVVLHAEETGEEAEEEYKEEQEPAENTTGSEEGELQEEERTEEEKPDEREETEGNIAEGTGTETKTITETVTEEPAEEEPVKKELTEEPVILNGLIEEEGNWYYYEEGELIRGKELLISGNWYYFQEETGKMYRKRWRKSGTSYVFYGEDGARLSGFQKVGEYRYYFDEVTGQMKKGWMKTADGSTYMYFDGQGHMAEGYVTMNGYKYYFNPETGYMKKGWMKTEDGSTYYYFDGSGHAVTGEKTIGGYKYLFLETGYMKKGWVKTSDGKTYFYYDGQGHKAFGEKKINGYWYNFEEDTGRMIKGWMRIEYRNKTVYYDSQGHMVTGTYQTGNIVFTADKSTGAVYYTYVRNIPYYSQTDSRWSGIYIGNAGTIAQNGCGPAIGTSIINFYKGKGFTPVDTARLFNRWGHYNSKYGHGTDTGVWRVVANNYGLKFKNNLSLNEIKEQLRRGNLVTAAVGKGSFVNGNYTHFILLYGLDGDKCWVYDPLHSGRNGKYSVNSIYSQKSGLYVDNIDGGPFIALGNQ